MGFDLKDNSIVKSILALLTTATDTVGRIINIEIIHDLIHRGQVFTVSKTFKAVADNGYARIHISTGAKSMHFTFSYSGEGKAYLNTYSATTYSNNGTLQPIFNRNPATGYTPLSVAYHTPTINVLGSMRGDDFVGAGGNVQVQAGGTGIAGIETVIPPNSNILFQLQNVAGGVKDLGFIINFYEV